MQKKTIALLLCGSLAMTLLQGCAFPTETARVIDNRPVLTFKTDADASTIQLAVDGQPVGAASKYLDGKAGLRVLPGTHVITVTRPDGSQYTQRVYVSDGVTKTLIVQ